MIFYPYSLYLFLFKTDVPKYIKAFVIVITIGLVFMVVDVVCYPNRVHDEVILDNINSKKFNKEIDVGTVYNLDKKDLFEYKSEEYISYIIYDEYNMYYGIFEIIDYNKKYELVYLYQLSNEYKEVYNIKFDEFKGIHPIIFVHVLKDDNFADLNLGNKLQFEDITIKDIFENIKSQIVILNKEKFEFEFNDFGVLSYMSNSLDIEYKCDENPLLYTNFKSVYKVLYRNFNDKFDIVGFRYIDKTPTFNIMVGDTKYIVEYYYKEGSSLKSIEDEEKYYEFIKEREKINKMK